MKTLENKCWALWIAFLLFLLFTSCKSQKPIESNTDQKDFRFQFDSSVVKVIKTPGSNDSLFVNVPAVKTSIPKCDSICQVKIDEILKGINSKKTNGKNSSGFYYDSYKKMLVAYNNLKGSTDSIIKTAKGKKEYFEIRKTKTITINILTKEQLFNLWTGRLFWVALAVWVVFKIRKNLLA